MADEVTKLHDAIDALLAVDVGSLGAKELHELTIALQREAARLAVAKARTVEQWDRRGAWAGDGSRNAAGRLAREARCSLTMARVEVRRAHKCAVMPATVEAVLAGELSMDHVDLFGRARQPWRAAAFAGYEAELVEGCKKQRFPGGKRIVEYWCQNVDGADASDRAGKERAERSHLYASKTLDDMVLLDGLLDPVSGAVVLNELKRLEDQLRLADRKTGVDRTPAQRRVAALVEMATRSATAPAKGRRPAPLFTVVLGDRSFEHLCELADGTVISVAELVKWLDVAVLESILFDGKTTIVSVSKRRTFVGACRRAIEVRDRHCQHPSGCDVPAEQCDLDHTSGWTKTRRTSQFGTRMECSPHNRDETKHDFDATPYPERSVTILDELRGKARWRAKHWYGDDMPGDPLFPDLPGG